MSNVRMPFKRVNTSNLMTFECCSMISKIMRIAIQCHPSLDYVMYLGPLLFAVQRNVFISLLWFLFSDAASNEHSQLVEIPVERSSFKYNIQKSIPRSLQLKKYYVTFKNRNVQQRFEISMTDTLRDQLMANDKLPAFRLELKIFTRFVLKLVFRVSGRSVP